MQVTIIRRVRMSFTENEQAELASLIEDARKFLGKPDGQFNQSKMRLADHMLAVLNGEAELRRNK